MSTSIRQDVMKPGVNFAGLDKLADVEERGESARDPELM